MGDPLVSAKDYELWRNSCSVDQAASDIAADLRRGVEAIRNHGPSRPVELHSPACGIWPIRDDSRCTCGWGRP